jgi:hypothetical protein
MSLLADVRVCGTIPSRSVAFIFVEQTDVSFGNVINDTAMATNLADGQRPRICAQSKFEP